MSFKYLGIVFYSPAVDLNPLQNSSVPAAVGSVQMSCFTCLTLIQECCDHFLLWETKELLNKSLISFMTFTGFTCSIELVPAGPQTSLNYYNIISAPELNVFIFIENAFTWDVWEAGGDITDPCVEAMSSPASGIDLISSRWWNIHVYGKKPATVAETVNSNSKIIHK